MKNQISVCVITKNDADRLEKSLISLKPYEFELVVVDTGSTDNTKEIMAQYADVSGYFEWINDFSAARNYAASLASNDNILVLDSDEWVEACDVDNMLELIPRMRNAIGRMVRNNQIQGDMGVEISSERVARFYNRKYFRYEGSIHEQVCAIDKTIEAIYEEIDLECGHSGYVGSDDDLDEKTQRNIEMILAEIETEGADSYRMYQLGKSYFLRRDYSLAAKYFEEAWDYDVDVRYEYVQDMMECYGYALLKLDRKADMMILHEMFDVFGRTADYCFITGFALMNNGLFDEAIDMFVKATSYRHSSVSGSNSYKAWYNAGVICECLGRKKEAREYYLKCKCFEKAAEGLKRLGMSKGLSIENGVSMVA